MSEFDKDKDQMVHVGDCCDIGPHTEEVMRLLDSIDTIWFVGNHEISHLMKQGIRPYDSTLDVGPFNETWNKWIVERRAHFVLEIEGVVLSHAGISENLAVACKNDWKALNDDMFRAYATMQDHHPYFWSDEFSCLWWRPYDPCKPAPGVEQIVGHTPERSLSETALADKYMHYIDGYDKRGSFKYATIEDREVTVVTAFSPEHPIELYDWKGSL